MAFDLFCEKRSVDLRMEMPFDSFSPVAFRSFRSQCPLIDCSIMGKTKRFDLLMENRISDCWVGATFVKLCAETIFFLSRVAGALKNLKM